MSPRRSGSNPTVNFYREECKTSHGSDISKCDDDCNIVEVEYEVTGHVTAYVPARLHPVDLSHPAEGGEVEDIQVTLNGKDVDLDTFSQKEIESMEEQLAEAAADDDDGPDYDDIDDDRSPDSWDPPDRDDF